MFWIPEWVYLNKPFYKPGVQTCAHLLEVKITNPDANAAKLYRKARLHTRYLREPSLHLQGVVLYHSYSALEHLGLG